MYFFFRENQVHRISHEKLVLKCIILYLWLKKKSLQMFNLQGFTSFTIALSRRERDSNPRYSCPYTAFRVRPDRPLRHLSRSITNPSAGNSECKYSYFSQKKHFRNKKRFEFLFSPAQCISRFYCYFCEIMTHRQ